eukprot:g13387.t1
MQVSAASPNKTGFLNSVSRVQEARKKRSFPAAGSEKARGVWAFARAHPRNSNLAVLYLDSESSSCRGARSCGAAAAADDQQVGGPRAQHYVWLLYAVLLLLSDVTVYFEDDGAEQADDDVGLQKHAIQSVDQLEVVLRIEHDFFSAAELEAVEKRVSPLLREKRFDVGVSLQNLKSLSSTRGGTTGGGPGGVHLPPTQHKLLTGQDVAALLKRYLNAVSTRSASNKAALLQQEKSTSGAGAVGDIGAAAVVIHDIAELPTYRELLTQLAGERCIKGALEYFGGCISRDIVLPSENFEAEVFGMLENAREFLIQSLEENTISEVEMEKYLGIFDKKVGNKFETKFLPLHTSYVKKASDLHHQGGSSAFSSRTPSRRTKQGELQHHAAVSVGSAGDRDLPGQISLTNGGPTAAAAAHLPGSRQHDHGTPSLAIAASPSQLADDRGAADHPAGGRTHLSKASTAGGTATTAHHAGAVDYSSSSSSSSLVLAKIPVLDASENSFLYRKWMENRTSLLEKNRTAWIRNYWQPLEDKCRRTITNKRKKHFELIPVGGANAAARNPYADMTGAGAEQGGEWSNFELQHDLGNNVAGAANEVDKDKHDAAGGMSDSGDAFGAFESAAGGDAGLEVATKVKTKSKTSLSKTSGRLGAAAGTSAPGPQYESVDDFFRELNEKKLEYFSSSASRLGSVVDSAMFAGGAGGGGGSAGISITPEHVQEVVAHHQWATKLSHAFLKDHADNRAQAVYTQTQQDLIEKEKEIRDSLDSSMKLQESSLTTKLSDFAKDLVLKSSDENRVLCEDTARDFFEKLTTSETRILERILNTEVEVKNLLAAEVGRVLQEVSASRASVAALPGSGTSEHAASSNPNSPSKMQSRLDQEQLEKEILSRFQAVNKALQAQAESTNLKVKEGCDELSLKVKTVLQAVKDDLVNQIRKGDEYVLQKLETVGAAGAGPEGAGTVAASSLSDMTSFVEEHFARKDVVSAEIQREVAEKIAIVEDKLETELVEKVDGRMQTLKEEVKAEVAGEVVEKEIVPRLEFVREQLKEENQAHINVLHQSLEEIEERMKIDGEHRCGSLEAKLRGELSDIKIAVDELQQNQNDLQIAPSDGAPPGAAAAPPAFLPSEEVVDEKIEAASRELSAGTAEKIQSMQDGFTGKLKAFGAGLIEKTNGIVDGKVAESEAKVLAEVEEKLNSRLNEADFSAFQSGCGGSPEDTDKIASLKERVASTEEKVAGLEERIFEVAPEKGARLEDRVRGCEERVCGMEGRFAGQVEGRFADQDGKLAELQNRVTAVEALGERNGDQRDPDLLQGANSHASTAGSDEVKTDLGLFKAEVGERLGVIHEKLSGLEQENSSQAVDERLHVVDGKLEELGGQLEGVGGRFVAVDGRFESMSAKLAADLQRLQEDIEHQAAAASVDPATVVSPDQLAERLQRALSEQKDEISTQCDAKIESSATTLKAEVFEKVRDAQDSFGAKVKDFLKTTAEDMRAKIKTHDAEGKKSMEQMRTEFGARMEKMAQDADVDFILSSARSNAAEECGRVKQDLEHKIEANAERVLSNVEQLSADKIALLEKQIAEGISDLNTDFADQIGKIQAEHADYAAGAKPFCAEDEQRILSHAQSTADASLEAFSTRVYAELQERLGAKLDAGSATVLIAEQFEARAPGLKECLVADQQAGMEAYVHTKLAEERTALQGDVRSQLDSVKLELQSQLQLHDVELQAQLSASRAAAEEHLQKEDGRFASSAALAALDEKVAAINASNFRTEFADLVENRLSAAAAEFEGRFSSASAVDEKLTQGLGTLRSEFDAKVEDSAAHLRSEVSAIVGEKLAAQTAEFSSSAEIDDKVQQNIALLRTELGDLVQAKLEGVEEQVQQAAAAGATAQGDSDKFVEKEVYEQQLRNFATNVTAKNDQLRSELAELLDTRVDAASSALEERFLSTAASEKQVAEMNKVEQGLNAVRGEVSALADAQKLAAENWTAQVAGMSSDVGDRMEAAATTLRSELTATMDDKLAEASEQFVQEDAYEKQLKNFASNMTTKYDAQVSDLQTRVEEADGKVEEFKSQIRERLGAKFEQERNAVLEAVDEKFEGLKEEIASSVGMELDTKLDIKLATRMESEKQEMLADLKGIMIAEGTTDGFVKADALLESRVEGRIAGLRDELLQQIAEQRSEAEKQMNLRNDDSITGAEAAELVQKKVTEECQKVEQVLRKFPEWTNGKISEESDRLKQHFAEGLDSLKASVLQQLEENKSYEVEEETAFETKFARESAALREDVEERTTRIAESAFESHKDSFLKLQSALLEEQFTTQLEDLQSQIARQKEITTEIVDEQTVFVNRKTQEVLECARQNLEEVKGDLYLELEVLKKEASSPSEPRSYAKSETYSRAEVDERVLGVIEASSCSAAGDLKTLKEELATKTLLWETSSGAMTDKLRDLGEKLGTTMTGADLDARVADLKERLGTRLKQHLETSETAMTGFRGDLTDLKSALARLEEEKLSHHQQHPPAATQPQGATLTPGFVEESLLHLKREIVDHEKSERKKHAEETKEAFSEKATWLESVMQERTKTVVEEFSEKATRLQTEMRESSQRLRQDTREELDEMKGKISTKLREFFSDSSDTQNLMKEKMREFRAELEAVRSRMSGGNFRPEEAIEEAVARMKATVQEETAAKLQSLQDALESSLADSTTSNFATLKAGMRDEFGQATEGLTALLESRVKAEQEARLNGLQEFKTKLGAYVKENNKNMESLIESKTREAGADLKKEVEEIVAERVQQQLLVEQKSSSCTPSTTEEQFPAPAPAFDERRTKMLVEEVTGAKVREAVEATVEELRAELLGELKKAGPDGLPAADQIVTKELFLKSRDLLYEDLQEELQEALEEFRTTNSTSATSSVDELVEKRLRSLDLDGQFRQLEHEYADKLDNLATRLENARTGLGERGATAPADQLSQRSDLPTTDAIAAQVRALVAEHTDPAKLLNGFETKIEDAVLQKLEEQLSQRLSSQIAIQLDEVLTEKMEHGFNQMLENLKQSREQEKRREEEQIQEVFAGLETKISQSNELARIDAENLREHVIGQLETVKEKLATLEKNNKAPTFVTDLWTSIGEMASRITDLQLILDNYLGSRKIAMLKHGVNSPSDDERRGKTKNSHMSMSVPGNSYVGTRG